MGIKHRTFNIRVTLKIKNSINHIKFNMIGPKLLSMEMCHADSELLLMELPWRFQGQKFGMRNSNSNSYFLSIFSNLAFGI